MNKLDDNLGNYKLYLLSSPDPTRDLTLQLGCYTAKPTKP